MLPQKCFRQPRRSRTGHELLVLQSLPAQVVTRQFEHATTLGSISTTVRDVRSSTTDNAHRVELSWTNVATGEIRGSSVELTGDGYGTYFGRIRSGSSFEPLGVEDGYTVAAKATVAAWAVIAAGADASARELTRR